jgi:hypothetical protein
MRLAAWAVLAFRTRTHSRGIATEQESTRRRETETDEHKKDQLVSLTLPSDIDMFVLSIRKTKIKAVGIRRADHATPFYLQKLVLTSPTSGDC